MHAGERDVPVAEGKSNLGNSGSLGELANADPAAFVNLPTDAPAAPPAAVLDGAGHAEHATEASGCADVAIGRAEENIGNARPASLFEDSTGRATEGPLSSAADARLATMVSIRLKLTYFCPVPSDSSTFVFVPQSNRKISRHLRIN